MSQGSTDEKLIRGLLSQDRKLIEELYMKLRPAAAKIILQLGGQETDVNDMLQEAVIALFVNLKKNQFQQHSQVKLSSYILQIVKYQWLNNRNRASRQREEALQEHHDVGSDINLQLDLENIERNLQLRKILKLLPERCQHIFELFYWKKLNMTEIADQLKISADSAKNAKYRCMQKAKALYKQKNIKLLL